MKIVLTFPDNTSLETTAYKSDLTINEVYYNELRHADSSAKMRLAYDENIVTKIKANINGNIRAQIVDDEDENVFTGYLRKTAQFSTKFRPQPYAIEIVPASFLFDVTHEAFVEENQTLASIVAELIGFTDYEGTIDTSALDGETLPVFVFEEDSNIKSVLETLLFEYGYSYTFDNDGDFRIISVKDTMPSTIEQTFSSDNCFEEITHEIRENSYKRNTVSWTKVEYKEGEKVFEDNTGKNASYAADIEIPATSYYGNSESNYCEYAWNSNVKNNGIVWVKSATKDVTFDDASGIVQNFENLGKRALLSIYNSNAVSRRVRKLVITGNGYFITNEEKTSSGGSDGNLNEYESKYITTEEAASALSRLLTDYYNYSNLTATCRSKTNYATGSYVVLSDEGIGTIYARVVQKQYEFATGMYNYTLESVMDYTPTVTVTRKQSVDSLAGKAEGPSGRDGQNSFTIQLFRRSSNTPSAPTGSMTYNFVTGELTGDLGQWTQFIPAIDSDNLPCYAVYKTVSSNYDTITFTDGFSTPQKILADGNLTKADVLELINQTTPPPSVLCDKTFIGFYVDSEGKAVASQQSTSRIDVFQTGEALDFQFGTITVPSGFSYETDGNNITLAVARDALVKSGTINVPVSFRAYKTNVIYKAKGSSTGTTDDEPRYVSSGTILGSFTSLSDIQALTPSDADIINWHSDTDAESVLAENGVFLAHQAYYWDSAESLWRVFNTESNVDIYGYYVLEDQATTYNIGIAYTEVRGGRNRGPFETVASIPTTDNILGDYMTFTGTDASSSKSSTGNFKQCAVYVWHGTYWEPTTAREEVFGSLSDVLSVANADLATNNSQVKQFVDRLVAHEVFADNIVSNTAFIDRIFAQEITAGSVFTDYLETGGITVKGNIIAETIQIMGRLPSSNLPSDTVYTAGMNTAINSKVGDIGSNTVKQYTDTAKSSAISTASADATSKASSAQSAAITAAASDATTKANTALNSAKTYADGVGTSTLNSSKTYADGVGTSTLNGAKDYSDGNLQLAKNYADSVGGDAEEYADARRNDVAQKLGYTNWDAMVQASIDGKSILNDVGYINADVIDVQALVAVEGNFDGLTVDDFKATNANIAGIVYAEDGYFKGLLTDSEDLTVNFHSVQPVRKYDGHTYLCTIQLQESYNISATETKIKYRTIGQLYYTGYKIYIDYYHTQFNRVDFAPVFIDSRFIDSLELAGTLDVGLLIKLNSTEIDDNDIIRVSYMRIS